MTPSTITAYLLLGSNDGDRSQNLMNARSRISHQAGAVSLASSLYQTDAWGNTAQPYFLNQVIRIETRLSPENLLTVVLAIEKDLGRVRGEKWGIRIIDIDILFYGNSIIHSENLQIPHPGIAHRRFTLVPLHEIAPALVHPVTNMTIASMLNACNDPLEVRKYFD